LAQFTLADAPRCFTDPAAGIGRAKCRSKVKRLGEQIIAKQNTGVFSPQGVCGWKVAPRVSPIEHIVMNQCGGMHHFQDDRQRDMVIANLRRASTAAGQ
jgi:hypothetical protein